MTGIRTSIRMASNSPDALFAKRVTACWPSHAFVTVAPSFWIRNSAISMFSSLSSTSRICSPRMDPAGADGSGVWLPACVSILKGIVITKVVPTPCVLSKLMVPPIFSARLLAMDMPRPVPPNLDAPPFCSCVKGSKIRCWNSSLMPMPLSSQTNCSVAMLLSAEGSSRVYR